MRETRKYTFVDYATQGYLALVGLIVLCLHGRAVPFWPLLLAAHAAGIGLIHALIRIQEVRPGSRVLDFLRHFYPMLLYGPFYCETGKLNHLLVPGFLDPSFIRLEARLFGVQPGLAFMDRLPCLAVSELFYAAYFSYYLMIAGVALALFLRNRSQFLHFVSVISFVFYVCYLIFIFAPVVGPLVFFREIPGYRLPADVQLAEAPIFPAAIQAGLLLPAHGVGLSSVRRAGGLVSQQPCRGRHWHGLFLLSVSAADSLAALCRHDPALRGHGLLPLSLRRRCRGRSSDGGGADSPGQLASFKFGITSRRRRTISGSETLA